MIYAFYGIPIESEMPRQRPARDSQGVAICSVGIEPTLPSKYKAYEDVFSKKECETVPDGTGITHAINLKERTKLLYSPIYTLSERELRILRDYFAEKEIIG